MIVRSFISLMFSGVAQAAAVLPSRDALFIRDEGVRIQTTVPASYRTVFMAMSLSLVSLLSFLLGEYITFG
jgi:hypothetical protein